MPFSYKIKTGRNGELTKELWIDRRESSKSLTWSSVQLAFEKTEGKPLVERPKALGDIRGVAYIYGMFYVAAADYVVTKAKADAKAAEEAKKAEAESVLKKLLAEGMSADEILAKLK